MEILLREYLDCEYQNFTSEEFERLSDSDGSLSKTAKQLLGVAKQFGSIGKSVSKRLWSMAKRPKSPPSTTGGLSTEGLLCVRIRSRRHQYVDQMLQNYLQCAHARFYIITDLFYFDYTKRHYLVLVMFDRYLQDHKVDDTGSEMNYGAGKSKFYAASDRGSHASVSKLLPANPNKDRTLYLSRYFLYSEYNAFLAINSNKIFLLIVFHRSTFYNDQASSDKRRPERWNNSNSLGVRDTI